MVEGQGGGQRNRPPGNSGGRRRRRKRSGGASDASGGSSPRSSSLSGDLASRDLARGGHGSGANKGHSDKRPKDGVRRHERKGDDPRRSDKARPSQENAPKKKVAPEIPFQHIVKRYGLAIFDTFQQAKAERAELEEKAKTFDQLNIVIRAEGNMDDPELVSIGNVKVFAGAAWALIHERRKQDGWYDEPR